MPTPLFQPGNKLACGKRGNPYAGDREKWRAHLHKATSPEQFNRIVRRTLALAEEGEEWAVREIFDRLMGKASQPIEIEARINVAQVWDASADDLVSLAIKAGLTDKLPERLRLLAAEQSAQPEVIDVPFSANAQTVDGTVPVDSPTPASAE